MNEIFFPIFYFYFLSSFILLFGMTDDAVFEWLNTNSFRTINSGCSY